MFNIHIRYSIIYGIIMTEVSKIVMYPFMVNCGIYDTIE
jgi:hypothetical protein